MPVQHPDKKSEEAAHREQTRPLTAHEEFALRAAKPLPLPVDKETIDEALEAGMRAEIDPDNLENKPLLDAGKLGLLSEAFSVLAAGETIGTSDRVTGVGYDHNGKKLLAVNDPEAQPLPPIPLLEAVAGQTTLEGQSREESYPNVRLAFALTARALGELDEEKEQLSAKALSAVQTALQRICELTIHYPLASLSEGLTKHQIAGLLNAINMTITSDPVKAVLWRDRDPLQKALDRL